MENHMSAHKQFPSTPQTSAQQLRSPQSGLPVGTGLTGGSRSEAGMGPSSIKRPVQAIGFERDAARPRRSWGLRVWRRRLIPVVALLAATLVSGVAPSSAVVPVPPVVPASGLGSNTSGASDASNSSAASNSPASSNRSGTNPYSVLKAPKDDGRLHLVLASPKGQLRLVTKSTELRWVFDRPIIALSTIDQRTNAAQGATQTTVAALANADPKKYVQIEPAIEGSFRWSSTRVLVFTPSKKLPLSQRTLT